MGSVWDSRLTSQRAVGSPVDTTAEAERVQLEVFRRMGPENYFGMRDLSDSFLINVFPYLKYEGILP